MIGFVLPMLALSFKINEIMSKKEQESFSKEEIDEIIVEAMDEVVQDYEEKTRMKDGKTSTDA